MSNSHQYSASQSTAYSENADSIATTLLGSGRGSASGSFDDAIKPHGGTEMARRDVQDGDQTGYRRDSTDSHASSSYSSSRENARLLTSTPPPPATTTSRSEPSSPRLPPRTPEPVTWSQLPHKPQLAILTLARLSEPLAQTSLQSYMFYQLKSFHAPDAPPPTDATVARQVGLLAAAFTGAQFLTAIAWGRVADSPRVGRKRVILIGLLGTAAGSLGFGFSGGFAQAMAWRAGAGLLNGNVGVMRTMVSEMVREKRFLSRAFLLLPMTFNIGVVIGPLIGGVLADPVRSWPGVFGAGGWLGGDEGVAWLSRWPYALPNVVNAGFLVFSAALVVFGLEETLERRRRKADWGLKVSRWVRRVVFRRRGWHEYRALETSERDGGGDVEMAGAGTGAGKKTKPKVQGTLPFRRIWTPNVLFTLLAHFLLAFHVGTCNSLWFVFLSTPRYDPDNTTTTTATTETHPPSPSVAASSNTTTPLLTPPNYHPHPPFTFTGGLALPPPSIGTALAILGSIGLLLQLLLYPRLSFRLGTERSYRLSLLLFPLSYTLTPYLATLPSRTAPPGPASGALIWAAITLVSAIQVLGRTFALPSAAILINNSSPHPSVLGTVHGIAQSVSSAARTLGPVLVGWAYGVGLDRGVVGLAWWGMAGVAVVGVVAGRFVREGDGHEILLEGEEREGVEGDEGGRGKG